MDTRTFPSLGVTASLLGFGCMRFPTLENEVIDFDQAKEMIDYAMAHGVNYYDTAYPYHAGNSEKLLSRTLIHDYPRDSFYLADKMPVWECHEYADFERLFNEQLNRLNTDYIDFYLVHCLTKDNWANMEKLDIGKFLKEKKAQGKIRHIGFSFHDTPEVLHPVLDGFDGWEFAQIQLNYFDWDFQKAGKQYQLLTDRGLPVIVMEGVRGGALASFNGKQAEILTAVNKEASFASWALRWIARLQNVLTILSGMSTLDQVKDNLDTFSPLHPMSKEEERAIGDLVAYLNTIPLIPCTSCRYCCKDCPQGIDIPAVFHQYNEYCRFGTESQLTYWYLQRTKEGHLGDACIECGNCESMCPQHIEIREKLKEIHALALSLAKK